MRTKILIVASVLALFVTACDRSAVEVGQPPPDATSSPTPDCAATYAYESINYYVHESDAAIIGRVASVTEPRSNRPTAAPAGSPLRRYRDTNIRVERVLWSTPSLSVEPGQEVTVRLLDGGSHSGCSVGGSQLRMDEISGPVELETDVLFMLMRSTFYGQDDNTSGEPVVILTSGFLTNWTLRDGMAVNAHAELTENLQGLIDKLLLERARGALPPTFLPR